LYSPSLPTAPPPTPLSPLSLHDALPISHVRPVCEASSSWIGFAVARIALSVSASASRASWTKSRSLATLPLGGRRSISLAERQGDRKSTRLNSSHRTISYAVFCLKKKKK